MGRQSIWFLSLYHFDSYLPITYFENRHCWSNSSPHPWTPDTLKLCQVLESTGELCTSGCPGCAPDQVHQNLWGQDSCIRIVFPTPREIAKSSLGWEQYSLCCSRSAACRLLGVHQRRRVSGSLPDLLNQSWLFNKVSGDSLPHADPSLIDDRLSDLFPSLLCEQTSKPHGPALANPPHFLLTAACSPLGPGLVLLSKLAGRHHIYSKLCSAPFGTDLAEASFLSMGFSCLEHFPQLVCVRLGPSLWWHPNQLLGFESTSLEDR